MKGFLLIGCFVFVELLISIVIGVNSQDFCESYEKNNYSLIVYSQSKDTILLIVGTHFWRLKENNTELVFVKKSFKASNSSDQWTHSNYSFAHPVYDPKNYTYRGIALFQDQGFKDSKYFIQRKFLNEFYRFYGTYFEYLNVSYPSEPSGHELETRFVFTIFNEKLNVEIEQYIDDSGVYKRMSKYYEALCHRPLHCTLEYPSNGSFRNDTIAVQLEKLRDYKSNTSMIGSYLDSRNNIIYFFRIDTEIRYCAIEQCVSEEYKVLISCRKTNQSVLAIVWILIVLIVVVIVVFGVITAVTIFYARDPKTQPNVFDAQSSISSVNTRDSETGLPIEKSKTEKNIKLQSISMSSVSEDTNQKTTESGKPKTDAKELKKGSPKKNSMPTKPVKQTIETKPKESPKPKK